jgi:hypothetical protein
MASATITVRMDVKCAECGKRGACDNDLCMSCTTRAMVPERNMKSEQGKAVQARWQEIRRTRSRS